jgi:hypothetical protein
MTNLQEAHDRMHRIVSGYSDGNTDKIQKLPEYLNNLANLKTTTLEIQEAAILQKIDTKGVTKYKLQLRNQLIILGADNARKLSSYAILTKDKVLFGKVDYSEAEFKRFSDESLKDYAQIIYNLAEPIIDQLATYDITPETQVIFIDAINKFTIALDSPNLVATIRKQATETLARLIKAGDGYVANMAAAVEIVKLKDPIFYLGFKSAKRITLRGKVKLSVKGQSTDINGIPLPKVRMIVTLNDEIILVRRTSVKGGFRLKSLSTGTYLFTFKRVGYVDQTVVVYVNEGEITKVLVKMVEA